MSAAHPVESEYNRLVEPHRRELHAHCYRMLGSSEDAEEALQEALVRAWRGLPRFQGRSSVRAWLYRISTNVCLDEIQRRPKRVLPLDGGSPFEPVGSGSDAVLDPVAPEATPEDRFETREDLERALAGAFAHLTPRARTVLVLRAGLGYSAREVAERLGTSVAAVNSSLQRARATLERKPPAGHLGTTTPNTIKQCATAIEAGDAEQTVRLLWRSSDQPAQPACRRPTISGAHRPLPGESRSADC
jgi:RNA polymerase sigma-70 factor (ECF subfamily)